MGANMKQYIGEPFIIQFKRNFPNGNEYKIKNTKISQSISDTYKVWAWDTSKAPSRNLTVKNKE